MAAYLDVFPENGEVAQIFLGEKKWQSSISKVLQFQTDS